jgi:hypothetical protein
LAILGCGAVTCFTFIDSYAPTLMKKNPRNILKRKKHKLEGVPSIPQPHFQPSIAGHTLRFNEIIQPTFFTWCSMLGTLFILADQERKGKPNI